MDKEGGGRKARAHVALSRSRRVLGIADNPEQVRSLPVP